MEIKNINGIFNTINNGIIILDENLNILFWNRWLELRTKINSEDILGDNICKRFTNIKQSILIRKVKSSLTLNTPSFYSTTPHKYLIDISLNNITNKVYDSMQQSVTVVPYDLEKKQVCIYIYDNTPLCTTNYKLSRALDELEIYKNNLEQRVGHEVKLNQEKDTLLSEQSKLALMGEMIGAIAHQWRQPLNAISGNIQFLEDDFEDELIDEEYVEKFISKNMELISFMSNTIDDFRNFFRVNKEESIFSVRQKIIETLNILKSSIDSNKIDLVLNTQDFNVKGMPTEFQQVILNIVNNAKDALVAKNISDKKIIIDISSSGTITVNDNANGVPKNILNRIFEPYYTTKEEGKGTGIGLYMSKAIIEEHMNGKLSVSNNSLGALFEIKLQVNDGV